MAQILSIASDNWSAKKAAFNIAGSHACCLEHPDPKVAMEESLQLYFYHLFRPVNNKTKVLRRRNRLVARVCRRYFNFRREATTAGNISVSAAYYYPIIIY